MNNNTTERAKNAAHVAAHSAAADKAKGHSNEVIGKIKEKVGNAIGDHELETKGQLQNAEGKKDRLKGEIKETIEDAKQKVKAGVEVIKEKIAEARSK